MCHRWTPQPTARGSGSYGVFDANTASTSSGCGKSRVPTLPRGAQGRREVRSENGHKLDVWKGRKLHFAPDHERLHPYPLPQPRCPSSSQGHVRLVDGRLNAKTGMFPGVGDPIGEILQLDRVEAVIGLPESDVTAVPKLNEVNVEIKALGDYLVSGKIHFISSSPETLARLYRLELELDNPDHTIPMGWGGPTTSEMMIGYISYTSTEPVEAVDAADASTD